MFASFLISRASISIHTPAKGVTPNTLFQVVGLRNFNPHSREGSDCVADF